MSGEGQIVEANDQEKQKQTSVAAQPPVVKAKKATCGCYVEWRAYRPTVAGAGWVLSASYSYFPCPRTVSAPGSKGGA